MKRAFGSLSSSVLIFILAVLPAAARSSATPINLYTLSPAMFTQPGTINTSVPLSNGRMLIEGSFVLVGGEISHGLAIIDANGVVDAAFDQNLRQAVRIDQIFKVAIQSDGKIIAAGLFRVPPNPNLHFLLRFQSDGRLDNTFNPTSLNGSVDALFVDGSTILVGGNFTAPTPHIVRLDMRGGPVASFNGLGIGPDGNVKDIARQSSGKFILAG